MVLLRESRRRARGIYKIFKFEGYRRKREKCRERAQRETEDHANASPPRPRARKTLNYFSREKTQKESVFVRRRDTERERERERTISTLCVICVKLSVKLRHETLQFFPSRREKKTIIKRVSNEKRNETCEKRRTNERTGTVQKRSLLLSRRVCIIFGMVVLLCARSSFSICSTSTREERTGAFISNLIRVL